MNGTNADPHFKAIYEQWLARHGDDGTVIGSRAVDMKGAIVEHFKDRASIMIATEAAAEGINLQFCSLVVNYDLPWNPQRVEQRIGRCHRYGQKHDVVVLNFLNKRNEADQRVFQLLSEKFQLFGGVFGASDEVLGALESGVDIERRIAQVYLSCRTSADIAAAFDKLQAELDEQIQARMAQTREKLLEHFDEDVSARLRINRDKTLESLSNRELWLLELTRAELKTQARFDDHQPRFHYDGPDSHRGWYHFDWKQAEADGDVFYRQDHPLAVHLIQESLGRKLPVANISLDYAAHGSVVSVLKPLIGVSGWLEASKRVVESLESEEFIVLAATTDDGRALDEEVCQKLLILPANVRPASGTPIDLSPIRDSAIGLRLKEIEGRNAEFFDEEVLKLDRWSDDLKQGLEREIKEIDKQIKEARRIAALAAALRDKLEAQKTIKSLESDRNAKRRDLFIAQDAIDAKREGLIGEIEKQLKQRHQVEPLFAVRWTIK